MKMVNLCPHTIDIVRKDGSVLSIPPSGVVARVAATTEVMAVVNGIEISRPVYGEVVNLPEPDNGVLFIVSGLVRAAVPERTDVVSPGTHVRDEKGVPVGCKGLSCN